MLHLQQLLARARLQVRALFHVLKSVTTAPLGYAGQGPFSSPLRHRTMGAAVLLCLLLLASGMASAFTTPAAGDFGYDVYDIVVNQILNGPIGFIGGLFLIVFGVTQIMKNWMMTILCIIAGTVLIRAEAMVVTLGATVR